MALKRVLSSVPPLTVMAGRFAAEFPPPVSTLLMVSNKVEAEPTVTVRLPSRRPSELPVPLNVAGARTVPAVMLSGPA